MEEGRAQAARGRARTNRSVGPEWNGVARRTNATLFTTPAHPTCKHPQKHPQKLQSTTHTHVVHGAGDTASSSRSRFRVAGSVADEDEEDKEDEDEDVEDEDEEPLMISSCGASTEKERERGG